MKHAPMLVMEKAFESRSLPPLDREKALTVINKMAQEPVAAEQVYLGRALLANDQVDRSAERFPISYLERFAQTLPGKPVLAAHDKRSVPHGRWIGASIAKDDSSGVVHLVADFFLDNESEIARLVRIGVAKEVSIGFLSAGRTCDLDGEPIDGPYACGHKAGGMYDGRRCTVTYSGDVSRVEAFEGSFVGVGAQYGAEAIAAKAFMPGAGVVHQILEETMETKELEERIKVLTEENTTLKESAMKAAVLEARAKDGEQYLTDLKAEIARKLGVLEEDPGPELKLLENANLETLKAWDERLVKRIDVKFPPTGVAKVLGNGPGFAVPAEGPGSAPPPAEFDPHRSLKRAY
jgi:hypothetical protein